jgi:hypothetical protein
MGDQRTAAKARQRAAIPTDGTSAAEDTGSIVAIPDPGAGKLRVVRLDHQGRIIEGLAELTPPPGARLDGRQVFVGHDASPSGGQGDASITLPTSWQVATNPAAPIVVHSETVVDTLAFDDSELLSEEAEQARARRQAVQAYFEARPDMDIGNMFAWPNLPSKAEIDAVFNSEDFTSWQAGEAAAARRRQQEAIAAYYQRQLYASSGMWFTPEEAREIWERNNGPADQTEWEREQAAQPGGLPNEIRAPGSGELLGYRTVTVAEKALGGSIGTVTYTTLDRNGRVVDEQEVTALSPGADLAQGIVRGAPITSTLINLAETGGLSLDLRDFGRFLTEGERIDRGVSAIPFGDTVRQAAEAAIGVSLSGRDIDPLIGGAGEVRILSDRERTGKALLVVVDLAGEAMGMNLSVKPKAPHLSVDIPGPKAPHARAPKVPHADAPRAPRAPDAPHAQAPGAPNAPRTGTPDAPGHAARPRQQPPAMAAPKGVPDAKPAANSSVAHQGGGAKSGKKPAKTAKAPPNPHREQYKAAEGVRRWRQRVDEWADRVFGPDPGSTIRAPRVTGRAQPRIDGKRVPGAPPVRLDRQHIPLRPGETADAAVARVSTVFGRKLSDYPFLQSLWNDARASVLRRRTLTADNYADLYDLTRNAFWRRVRGRGADALRARQHFADAGFDLPSGSSRAPELAINDPSIGRTERSVSLDHIEEKGQGQGWRKALDADNLRMEPAMPNTHRENIQMRHPELRPDAPRPAGVSHFPEKRRRRAGPAPAETEAPAAKPRQDAPDADKDPLMDAVMEGRLDAYLRESELIDAALRGDLLETLHPPPMGKTGAAAPDAPDELQRQALAMVLQFLDPLH